MEGNFAMYEMVGCYFSTGRNNLAFCVRALGGCLYLLYRVSKSAVLEELFAEVACLVDSSRKRTDAKCKIITACTKYDIQFCGVRAQLVLNI
jgi:hypothetical protein